MPLLRSRLIEPMKVGEAKVDAGSYTAAAQLLIVALTYHPSLVDLLLSPSRLAEAAQDAAPAEGSTAVSTLYQSNSCWRVFYSWMKSRGVIQYCLVSSAR